MSVFASQEHPTSDVLISFQWELETGALWVTICIAICLSLPKFHQVWDFFNVYIGLCPRDVGSVHGTVPAAAAEARRARTSAGWAALKTTAEGDCCSAAHAVSPVLQGRRVPCSNFTNSRTELSAFGSVLLRRMGMVDEVPFHSCCPHFAGRAQRSPSRQAKLLGEHQSSQCAQKSANQVET